MRALPDLDNVEAMARRGRGSALASARNEAAELLRDCVVRLQSLDIFRDDVTEWTNTAREALDRLELVARLAKEKT